MAEVIADTEVINETAEDTMKDNYLVLYLDDRQYAIAIEYVVDIINVQPITRVPFCPPFVIGVTNLRGKVIPIVDLRLRFGKTPKEFTDRTCIIFLEDKGASVGLIVDSVSEVAHMDESMISPPPTYNTSLESRFIQGVGKSDDGIKLILDCNTVLDDLLIDNHSDHQDDY